jgi:hypothetical protein
MTAVQRLVQQLNEIKFYTEEARENTIEQALQLEKEQNSEKYKQGYERGLNSLIPLIENLQNEITKLKRNL